MGLLGDIGDWTASHAHSLNDDLASTTVGQAVEHVEQSAVGALGTPGQHAQTIAQHATDDLLHHPVETGAGLAAGGGGLLFGLAVPAAIVAGGGEAITATTDATGLTHGQRVAWERDMTAVVEHPSEVILGAGVVSLGIGAAALGAGVIGAPAGVAAVGVPLAGIGAKALKGMLADEMRRGAQTSPSHPGGMAPASPEPAPASPGPSGQINDATENPIIGVIAEAQSKAH